jgi:ribonuclease-3
LSILITAWHLLQQFRKRSAEERQLAQFVRQTTGYSPYNLSLYQLAMKHTSVAEENKIGIRESNERLEYLGDAILGAVVAEYLFKRYPYKSEGFLTEIRSRIVNRESLNQLARKLGLDQHVLFNGRNSGASGFKSIYGDAMEAFVGAVYLDKGYYKCRKFIMQQLLQQHYDLDELISTTANYKSLLLEWAQKNNHKLHFKSLTKGKSKKEGRQFVVSLLLNDKEVAEGNGFSKKKAEQDAARRASEYLQIEQ